MNLAKEIQNIKPQACPSPWTGFEHYNGYGVMMLPFSSGDLLGLRVFPENDFAPYKSVWHCTPEGDWSIYNDGFSLDTTCPRWWGPALKHEELTDINLEWTGDNELHIKMQKPEFSWTMQMAEPFFLKILNIINRSMPLWVWKLQTHIKTEELASKWLLNMGKIRLAFQTPQGHDAVIMPWKIYFIDTASAQLNGRDLGKPVCLDDNPHIGDVPLPKRPTFMIGRAHGKIIDHREYRATREMIEEHG